MVRSVWNVATTAVLASLVLGCSDPVGSHDAIVWRYGSNAWPRDRWNRNFERYNRRRSRSWATTNAARASRTRSAAPGGSRGYFELLAGDLVGAVRLLATHPEADPSRIGLGGVSQGGWIVPLAGDNRANWLTTALAHTSGG